MAKRFTDTTKWDDDWFLELPPVMKCVWEYLRDNCEGGTGILRLSFRKMSTLIGAEITRDEFDKHLGSRIHWIDNDQIWIPQFLKDQFKNLNPRNKAHVNMATKVVEALGKSDLSGRHFPQLETLKSLCRGSSEAQGTLDRGSTEGQQTLIGYRIKDNILKEGECEGKQAGQLPAPAKSALPPLAQAWNEHCGEFSKVREVGKKRLQRINARMAECPDLEVWVEVIKRIAASDWCNARHEKNKTWKASFDFLLQEETRIFALEGRYDNPVKKRHMSVCSVADGLVSQEPIGQVWGD